MPSRFHMSESAAVVLRDPLSTKLPVERNLSCKLNLTCSIVNYD